MSSAITRRKVLGAGVALGVTAAGCQQAATPPAPATLNIDLSDPATRAMVRAKISGSIVEDTLHGLSWLHIYAYLNEGNVKPLITMANYTVTKWNPTDRGTYQMLHYESGVYTRFDTDEVLEEWENPITGEVRKVWPFIGGPIRGEVGPDGMVTGEEATVHPEANRISIIGDFVFVPTQSSFLFPNPLSAEQWPKESAGPMFHWDSFATQSARLEDVANPELTSAPVATQFQNLVTWHPWFGMGGQPGRTFGRAYGSKLAGGFADLPDSIKRGVEAQTPEILDIESWTEVRNDFKDFMQNRKPT